MDFLTDKRIQNRCPIETCKSVFIELLLNPIPTSRELKKRCLVCGHIFEAKREEDHREFKKQARVFNQ